MSVKVCSRCKQEKDIGEFRVRRNYNNGNPVVHGVCKACNYESHILRIKSTKLRLVKMKGGKCLECGYSKNLSAMDFHHRNPEEKEYSWAELITMFGQWDKVLAEVEKCDLLCARCHRELHHPDDEIDLIEELAVCPQCGGESYGRKYCCDECRHKARRVYERPPKEELQALLEEGLSYNKIRKQYGISHGTLVNWLAKYGLREYNCLKISCTID